MWRRLTTSGRAAIPQPRTLAPAQVGTVVAGALPAMLKNLLERTIGDAGTYGIPVACR